MTIRRIAETIEYLPTAIYLHFKDKETLIRELCREDSVSLAQAFHTIRHYQKLTSFPRHCCIEKRFPIKSIGRTYNISFA